MLALSDAEPGIAASYATLDALLADLESGTGQSDPSPAGDTGSTLDLTSCHLVLSEQGHADADQILLEARTAVDGTEIEIHRTNEPASRLVVVAETCEVLAHLPA